MVLAGSLRFQTEPTRQPVTNDCALKTLRKQDWFHEDGFPIVVARRDPQEPFGLHAHEFSEIVIVTGGKGLHVTGEDRYELATGDAFVIGGSRPHDYLNMQKLSLINVLFDPSDLPMTLSDLASLPGYHAMFRLEPAWRKRHRFSSRLSLSPSQLVDVNRIIDQLDFELQERNPGFGVMATALFMQLATYLSRSYSRSRNPESKALLRIGETISHIERNYASPIELAKLVEMSGMSRRNYIRTFESAMGCPPITYLIRLRVRHAGQMLKRNDSSITQIAFAVGFNDSNYFSRQFRAIQGCSPREYRDQYDSSGSVAG